MKSLAVTLVFLVAGAHAISFIDLILEEWDLFKVSIEFWFFWILKNSSLFQIQHKKKYDTDTEEKFRMKIFMDNRHKVAKHNAKFERGEINFQLGINKYSDMVTIQRPWVNKVNWVFPLCPNSSTMNLSGP